MRSCEENRIVVVLGLLDRVDFVARVTVARSPAAVVVDQNGIACGNEPIGVVRQVMFFEKRELQWAESA